jgi:hypothetical protein
MKDIIIAYACLSKSKERESLIRQLSIKNADDSTLDSYPTSYNITCLRVLTKILARRKYSVFYIELIDLLSL